MKQYKLYDYDVWGNEKDGYDVNNVWSTNEIYEISEKGMESDKQMIKELKKQGLIKKGIRFSSIDIDGDERTIYLGYKGKPEFELRLVDNK